MIEIKKKLSTYFNFVVGNSQDGVFYLILILIFLLISVSANFRNALILEA